MTAFTDFMFFGFTSTSEKTQSLLTKGMENLNKTHLELPFLKAETTLFKGPISNTIPDEQITMGQVLLGILKGRWQKEVKNVRELKNQYLKIF